MDQLSDYLKTLRSDFTREAYASSIKLVTGTGEHAWHHTGTTITELSREVEPTPARRVFEGTPGVTSRAPWGSPATYCLL